VSKAIDKTKRRDFVLAAVDLGFSIPGNNLHDWTKAEHAPGDAWWAKFKEVLSPEQWGALERAVIAKGVAGLGSGSNGAAHQGGFGVDYNITAPATPEAAEWQGWGTALKPAWEPICVARKPLVGTVAVNVLTHGTGALNIDGCRVEADGRPLRLNTAPQPAVNVYGDGLSGSVAAGETDLGRWPANLAHDGSDEVLACFPETKTNSTGIGEQLRGIGFGKSGGGTVIGARPGNEGSAARFYYCAKSSKAERGEGNDHPTVKPVDLMRWLVRLVTPPGGSVLDPFAGSGTTGIAASIEQFHAILIEQDPKHAALARERIKAEAGLFASVAAE
jgi:hypothetical protein